MTTLRRLVPLALAGLASLVACHRPGAVQLAEGASSTTTSASTSTPTSTATSTATSSAMSSAMSPASASTISPASSASVPAGSPLSRLIPASRPGLRPSCPLAIEPGVSFGPVLLGETLADLERAGLKVKRVSDTHAEIALEGATGEGATLKVQLCEGKIIEIWIDDLRTAPACVSFAGKAIAPATPRADVEALIGPCTDTDPRIGGEFERCAGGGVYVGHGLGTFLQLRVMPKAFPFDDACAVATDDGTPLALSNDERDAMLKATLNLSKLAEHWHVSLPGRDPLRLVRNANVHEHAFMEFGSDVVWIDEADAKAGTAYFRVTGLTATKTKATLTFEYPIEGVLGTATFERTGGKGAFRIARAAVRER